MIKATACAVLGIVIAACVTTPSQAQDVLFSDDFEEDSGLWNNYWGPVNAIVADPLDPTNHAASVGPVPNEPGGGSMTSVPVPMDMASIYVLSFRYLDPIVDGEGGAIFLEDASVGGWFLPISLIADGAWHTYTLEFTVRDVIDRSSGNISIIIVSPCAYRSPRDEPCSDFRPVFWDDFRMERTGTVPNESASWGRVKALYR